MFEIIAKAVFAIADSIMSLFSAGHELEKHLSKRSVVGESKLDKECRNWRERIFDSWWFATILITFIFSGLGFAIWQSLSDR